MRQLVDCIQEQSQLKAAFNLWLEVELAMLTERLKDDEKAESFCRRWQHEATAKCRCEAYVSTFDRHLFTVAATLAGNALCRQWENIQDQTTRLVHLHDELERYCGGTVSKDFAFGALVTDTGHVVSEKVRMADAPDLKSSLERVLATQTFRAEVEIISACVTERTEPPSDLSILSTDAGKMLQDCLRRQQRVELFEWRDGRNACPKCHLVLSESLKRDLQAQRIARCCHCQRFLVNRMGT